MSSMQTIYVTKFNQKGDKNPYKLFLTRTLFSHWLIGQQELVQHLRR